LIQARSLAQLFFGQGNFWGRGVYRGAKLKLGLYCNEKLTGEIGPKNSLCYYVYRKTIAVKVVCSILGRKEQI